MNTMIINGKRIETRGNNIKIKGSTLTVDGVTIDSNLPQEVTVKFEGDLASLECHKAIVNGNISGDVDCHNLSCKDIGGNVDAHNVTADAIKGKVKAHNVGN